MATHETCPLAIALIQKCTSINSLRKARQLHALILTTATALPTPFLNNNLISMYAKCGSLEEAQHVFDKMPLRNPVSYNALIAAYSRSPDHSLSALRLLQGMSIEGLRPNASTLSSLLRACCSLNDISNGAAIHSHVIKSGFLNDVPVQTSLLGMYSDCGYLESANQVFSMMVEQDAIAWNTIICGNMKNDKINRSLQLFCSMLKTSLTPTQVTFSIALNACSRLGDWSSGKIIHAQMIKSDFPADLPLHNALLHMYCSCGDLENAFSVFGMIEVPDLVSWNSIIASYSENGDGEMAMDIFIQLQHTSSLKPDEYTFAAIVSATGALPALNYGKPLHAQVQKSGFESNVYVGSTLINMYFKNDEIEYARKLFDSMLEKDVVLWTEMISGHSKSSEIEDAVKYFYWMIEEGHKVDSFALSSVLSSCADLALLSQGEMIHSQVVKMGCEVEMSVCGSLIDMYAKNGKLESARLVFSGVAEPDLKCWNSMLGGCSHHGYAQEAFELFNEMLKRGLRPDHVTFISLLSACGHCGLVQRGRFYWNYMLGISLEPGLKHYSCMVNLLGRAGLLREAEELINESPSNRFPELWRNLLSSCVNYRELEMGVHAAEQVLRLEPEDSATHILLSNLYAGVGRWDAVAELRRKIRGLTTEKDPGLSWIEITNGIHVFSADDESHPGVDFVRNQLQLLQKNMKGELSEMVFDELGYGWMSWCNSRKIRISLIKGLSVMA
ncbi:pentatricopeptide repeat (PPR) superfamily protein [Tasmannia lanceolata]|uniref:pentatricopeptide repeat (PPR) superfamily protein n=1 Tax=Tasmannia lanceolata TaxID=3420 RepID=UPI004063D4C6